MNLDVWADSVAGEWREDNEDLVVVNRERGLFAVVDGMGGREAGEVAAALTHDALERVCVGRPSRNLLEQALVEANAAMLVDSQRRGLSRPMGAAASVVWVDVEDPAGRALLAHVGDTRVLKFDAAGSGIQLSEDHTPADCSNLPDAVAQRDPRRHLVSRALGPSPREVGDPEWLQIRELALRPGDTLVLCSDGVGDYVERGRLARIVRSSTGDAQSIGAATLDAARQGQADRGQGDNVSVLVVHRRGFRGAAPVLGLESVEVDDPATPARVQLPDLERRVALPSWNRAEGAAPASFISPVAAAPAPVPPAPGFAEEAPIDLGFAGTRAELPQVTARVADDPWAGATWGESRGAAEGAASTAHRVAGARGQPLRIPPFNLPEATEFGSVTALTGAAAAVPWPGAVPSASVVPVGDDEGEPAERTGVVPPWGVRRRARAFVRRALPTLPGRWGLRTAAAALLCFALGGTAGAIGRAPAPAAPPLRLEDVLRAPPGGGVTVGDETPAPLEILVEEGATLEIDGVEWAEPGADLRLEVLAGGRVLVRGSNLRYRSIVAELGSDATVQIIETRVSGWRTPARAPGAVVALVDAIVTAEAPFAAELRRGAPGLVVERAVIVDEHVPEQRR